MSGAICPAFADIPGPLFSNRNVGSDNGSASRIEDRARYRPCHRLTLRGRDRCARHACGKHEKLRIWFHVCPLKEAYQLSAKELCWCGHISATGSKVRNGERDFRLLTASIRSSSSEEVCRENRIREGETQEGHATSERAYRECGSETLPYRGKETCPIVHPSGSRPAEPPADEA